MTDQHRPDPTPARTSMQWGHALLVLGICAFCLWFLHDTWRASRRFENLMLVLPVVVLTLLCAAGILIAMALRWKRGIGDPVLPRVDPQIPILMLLVGLYVLGLAYLQFDLVTFLFVVACLWLLGERNYPLLLGYAAGLTAFAVYGLRELISLPIPTLLFSGG